MDTIKTCSTYNHWLSFFHLQFCQTTTHNLSCPCPWSLWADFSSKPLAGGKKWSWHLFCRCSSGLDCAKCKFQHLDYLNLKVQWNCGHTEMLFGVVLLDLGYANAVHFATGNHLFQLAGNETIEVWTRQSTAAKVRREEKNERFTFVILQLPLCNTTPFCNVSNVLMDWISALGFVMYEWFNPHSEATLLKHV